MSLGKLRPVLYAGHCRVELPALDILDVDIDADADADALQQRIQ